VEGLGKNYGEKRVFSGASFIIERGDRIALVGVNGAGKSTLIKLLAGSEKPTAGSLRLGHNVEPDYFAQDQYKALDQEARVLDDLANLAPSATNTELRSLLGCFLFSDDDVFKPIGVLSGGERNRYALARMLMHPSNFLLMDEPTNHLDLRAKDVLLDALQKFTGTVVFVSHDRYFIDRLATRIFEVGDGQISVFPGNYEDYLWSKQGNGPRAEVRRTEPTLDDVPMPERSDGRRRVNPIKVRQMEERCSELEAAIQTTEKKISECESGLANFVSVEETQRLTSQLGHERKKLERLMKEWEEVAEFLQTNA
jgi:ATP-binding cassette subfamily F protein 3